MTYLIEFRFHEKAKYAAKRLARDIHYRFHIKTERHPHITLAGPLYTNDEKRLIRDFNQLCSKSILMNFEIDSFSTFEDSKVVYLDIKPSKELEEFRWNLSQILKPYCELTPYDIKRDFSFHATIASHIPSHKFENVKNYIKNQQKINFKHVMVRATLLKRGIILREYDFLLRRPLVRRLAKNKRIYSKTLHLLKGYFEGKYNPNEFTDERIKIQEKGLIDKIKELFSRKPKTFITSDLHLDHTNIIRYCKRPFLNTEDMNRTLVGNWNNTISNKDTVYFLGDLVCGRNSRPTDYWLKQLNGKIIFIKGSHDKLDKIKFHETYILEYKGYKFFLSHEPEQVPKDWNGWAICGHHHNNKMQEYPFIDEVNKRINVSVELTRYKPVDMDELIKKLEK